MAQATRKAGAAMKKIFTREGKELRKEFMGKARCCVTLHYIENCPQSVNSVFAMVKSPGYVGVTRVGTSKEGLWVWENTLEFEASLTVDKDGKMQPIPISIHFEGREAVDATKTVDIGQVDIDLTQQSLLDEQEMTNQYVPVGKAEAQSPPFLFVGTQYFYGCEILPSATDSPLPDEDCAPGTWSLSSLIGSAREAIHELGGHAKDDELYKGIVGKGEQVFEKVAADEETQKILNRNIHLIEREVDELAKTATGKEVKALVDHYSKKEETQKLLKDADALLDQVKAAPESQQLVAKAEQLLEKLEKDETSHKLTTRFRDTLSELSDEERRELLITRISNEEQRKAMAEELQATLRAFISSDGGKAAVQEGQALIKEGQKLLDNVTAGDGAKGLVNQLDSLLEDFEKNEIGGAYMREGRKLVNGFADDEFGKQALEKGELLLAKLAATPLDVQDIASQLLAADAGLAGPLAGQLNETLTLLDGIKEAVLHYLLKHLPDVDVPPVKGTSSETPLGAVQYMINGISFADLKLPESGVDADFDPEKGIHVSLTGIEVAVKDFTWAYQQDAWPHMHGMGIATTVVRGATISVALDFTMDEKRVKFELKDNRIEIQDLHIEAVGNKTPWLYNFLFYVFKNSVKRALEDNINEAITENVGQLLKVLNTLAVPALVHRVSGVVDAPKSGAPKGEGGEGGEGGARTLTP